MRLLVLFYARCRSTCKRTPHNEISNSVKKRNTENHAASNAEDAELPLCLQDNNLPASGVSEFERGWAVNDMTKKNDDKRKKELAAKKAEFLAQAAPPSSSNIIKDSLPKGKKGKGGVRGKVASKIK